MRPAASATPELANAPRIEGYKIVAEAGRGGMGVVYKAIQEVLGRPVAIKAVGGAEAPAPKRLERLVQEARVVAGMANHENIVQVYDVARDDAGRCHIVMEHVEGQTLAERLFGAKGLPLAEVCRVAREAAMALQHAHDHGVIHRDVKLENIMLTPAGKVKVMDFGVALGGESSGSRDAEPMGTPHYMAPEVLRGGPATPRSDVYSLAVVLYYLVAGKLPFDERDVLSVIQRQLTEEPRRPSRYCPALPPDLERVILRGLAKDPDERYDSAEIFAREIKRVEETCDLSQFKGPKAFFAPYLSTGGRRGPVWGQEQGGRYVETRELLGATSSSTGSSSSRLEASGRGVPFRPGDAPPCPDLATPPRRAAGAIKKFGLAAATFAALAGVAFFSRSALERGPDKAVEPPPAAVAPTPEAPLDAGYVVARFDFAVEGEGGPESLAEGRALAEGIAAWFDPEAAAALPRVELLKALGGLSDDDDGAAAIAEAGRDPKRAAEVARLAGANAALVGSVATYGERNATARLVDAETGAILGFATVGADDFAGLRDKLPGLAAELSASLPSAQSGESPAAAPASSSPVSEGGAIPTPDPLLAGAASIAPPLPTPEPPAEVDSGEVSRYLWHDGLIKSVVFLPGDEAVVATTSWDASAALWNVETGEEIRRFIGHTDWVTGVDASRAEPLILTASRDNTARLWDVATGREIGRFVHDTSVTSAAFSPDGTLVVTGCFDRAARLWSRADGRPIRRFDGHALPVLAVAFSPDGQTIATGSDDKTVRLWDVHSGWSRHTMAGHADAVKTVAFSPDGRHVASGGKDQVAILWDAATGLEIRRFAGHDGTIWNLAFSPDGSRLLTGSHDKSVILWDVATGQQIRRYHGHAEAVNAVAFSPSGRRAVTGSGRGGLRSGRGFGEAILWDLP